jgi:hypothetical protein
MARMVPWRYTGANTRHAPVSRAAWLRTTQPSWLAAGSRSALSPGSWLTVGYT